ncbi:uncharacterized protein BDV17DRAFT_293754 [Aspergillus undulatus]|uniref:uncharacterized protein n=1 Tax=Aspergillus undulatus TaxID=1810928 RepID=UPI003CCE4461
MPVPSPSENEKNDAKPSETPTPVPIRPALKRSTTTRANRPGIDSNGSHEGSGSGIKRLFRFGPRTPNVRLRSTNPDPYSSSGPSSTERLQKQYTYASGALTPVPVSRRNHNPASTPASCPPGSGSSRRDKSAAAPRSRLPVGIQRTVSGPVEASSGPGERYYGGPDPKHHSSMLTLLMGTIPGQTSYEEQRYAPSHTEKAPISNPTPVPQRTLERHRNGAHQQSSPDQSIPDSMCGPAPSNTPTSSPRSNQSMSISLPMRSLNAQEVDRAATSRSKGDRKRPSHSQPPAEKAAAAEVQSEIEDTTHSRFVICTRPSAKAPAPTIIPRSNGVFIHTGYPMDIADVQVCSASARDSVSECIRHSSMSSSPSLFTPRSGEKESNSETSSGDQPRRRHRDRDRGHDLNPPSLSQGVTSSSGKSPQQRTLLEEAGRAASNRRSRSMTPKKEQRRQAVEAEAETYSFETRITDDVAESSDNGYGRYEKVRLWG